MNPLSSITLRSDLKWSERCGVNEWEKEIAAVPYGDEGEAQEEAQCAANTGNQGGEGEDQLLLLHEGVVRSRPELEQEVLASPRQELLLTHLDVECEDGVVKYKPIDILDNDKAFDSQSGSQFPNNCSLWSFSNSASYCLQFTTLRGACADEPILNLSRTKPNQLILVLTFVSV